MKLSARKSIIPVNILLFMLIFMKYGFAQTDHTIQKKELISRIRADSAKNFTNNSLYFIDSIQVSFHEFNSLNPKFIRKVEFIKPNSNLAKKYDQAGVKGIYFIYTDYLIDNKKNNNSSRIFNHN